MPVTSKRLVGSPGCSNGMRYLHHPSQGGSTLGKWMDREYILQELGTKFIVSLFVNLTCSFITNQDTLRAPSFDGYISAYEIILLVSLVAISEDLISQASYALPTVKVLGRKVSIYGE